MLYDNDSMMINPSANQILSSFVMNSQYGTVTLITENNYQDFCGSSKQDKNF